MKSLEQCRLSANELTNLCVCSFIAAGACTVSMQAFHMSATPVDTHPHNALSSILAMRVHEQHSVLAENT